MKKPSRFSKLRVESLEERTLLAVMAGGGWGSGTFSVTNGGYDLGS